MALRQGMLATIGALTGLVSTVLAQTTLLSSRQSIQSANTSTIWPWLEYQSEPFFNPPELSISWNGEALEPGVILLEPRNFDENNATKQQGPLIMTPFGDLVWNGPTVDDSSPYEYSNFRMQALNVTEYLTYWHGYRQDGINSSIGYGSVSILNSEYEKQFIVCPHLGIKTQKLAIHHCDIDYNDQYITSWGTLLVTAYNLTQVDLTSIDIRTSKSIWKWSALDHIPLNASRLPLSDGAQNVSVAWDYVHIDSVSAYDGNLLVNARHTWDVYAIDRKDGDIMWTFNGETGGDWGIVPEESSFRWQYHTRVHDYGSDFVIFSMFVNHNYAGANGTSGTAPTVGREFRLSLPPSRDVSPLTLNTLNESSSLWSDSFGSMDYVPDQQNSTTRFLSYGQLPLLREFGFGPGPNVTDLKWEARYGSDNEVAGYRAYKGAWTGTPAQKPKLVLNDETAYMSWNGATEVKARKVYQESTANDTALSLVGIAQNRGFETAVDLGSVGCFLVEPVVPTGFNSLNSSVVCSS
ncbi:hypothetical protein N7540_005707 [Penicillium herquei]|nr:hypothetical protein N7540_005707 [Penicillium herquei]